MGRADGDASLTNGSMTAGIDVGAIVDDAMDVLQRVGVMIHADVRALLVAARLR